MFSSLQNHILIAGHSMASLAAGVALPCPPVDRPVLADFTGDGVTDFMLISANKYVK